MRKFEKCGNDDCQNDAHWIYMPGYSDGGSSFRCDEHVSRGCSCNTYCVNEEYRPIPEADEIEGVHWEWIKAGDERLGIIIKDEKTYWRYIDELGRPYPCCEYSYEDRGFYTEEYEKFLESECERIGYDLTADEDIQDSLKEWNEIVWFDSFIDKVEKIIEDYDGELTPT